METPVPRLPFWLHELIAEAKRRARHRRLVVVVLLLVVVAGATAAVVLRPSGGGSRSGGLSGRAGGTATSSHFVHFGAFVLTVPNGFHHWGATNASVGAFWVAHHPRVASTEVRLPAREVYLGVQAGSATPSDAQRLPLDLHKLHRSPARKHGTIWTGGVYGGHDGYLVMVFEGSKASAADRAAIERALRSIRRAS
jgi:hypothetical protein